MALKILQEIETTGSNKFDSYGVGSYFGITSSENQPKYTSAFGSGGKLVEDSRLVTIKITGTEEGWSSSTETQKTLIASPGTNSILVPREVLVYKSTTTSGEGWAESGNIGAWIGNVDGESYSEHFQIPLRFCRSSQVGFWFAPGPISRRDTFFINWATSWQANKALVFGTTSNVSNCGDWYIQLRYSVINVTDGITSNVDVTVN